MESERRLDDLFWTAKGLPAHSDGDEISQWARWTLPHLGL